MTLAEIREWAMDRMDEQTNPPSGKFSVAWWTRHINYVYRFLAQHTGFYIKRTGVTTTANYGIVPLPTDFCWGILRVTYDDTPLTATDVHKLDEDVIAWERQDSAGPTDYMVTPPNLEVYPAPERSVTAGETLIAAAPGGGFTAGAQPLGGQVKIKSTVGDDKQSVTVYGTTHRTGEVVVENTTLDGANYVTLDKSDWGYILGFELASACAGTIVMIKVGTVLQIGSISPAGTAAGVYTPTSAVEAGGTRPIINATGTSKALVGLVGTGTNGAAMTNNCATLSGSTTDLVTMPKAMQTITKVLCGCVPTGQNVVVTSGAALQIMHGALPTDLSLDTDVPTELVTGFHYLLADGAAALALTGDLRFNESVNAAVRPLIEGFWQGVGQLETFLEDMQRDGATVMRVESPHSPY